MTRREFAGLAAGSAAFSRAGGSPWLELVRRFADTLLDCGVDRFGSRPTPAWAGVIDTRDWTVPEKGVPPLPGIRESDRAVGGANLYHDAVTLRAFRALSDLTGDVRYRRAADAYMRWFLAEARHPATGFLAWGEHLYYDFFRDAVAVERKSHELLEWTPPWPLLWEINPASVTAAIAALRFHHYEDRPGSLYNRHAAFDRPEHQRPGGQPWIKHSGEYAYSFAFLYSKTGDRRWLDWAVGDAGIYWDRRHDTTGLTLSCIDDPRPMSRQASVQMAWLAYWLRKAGQCLPQQRLFRDRALAFVHAWEKYGWDSGRRSWRAGLNLDGTPAGSETIPIWRFAYGDVSALHYGRVAAYFAAVDRDAAMLDAARRTARGARESGIPEDASVQGLGFALNLALDLHAIDRDPQHLADAQRYARLVRQRFWQERDQRGLFVRQANDPYYESKTGVGDVVAGLLRLHAELSGRRLPGDWTF